MIEAIPDYLINALVAGFAMAMMAGPLGALVIWQRMAYFGDALAHASLLGIIISLFFAINITLGILMVALVVSLVLASMQSHTWFSSDTLLGLLSHTGLALGLLLFSLMPSKVDLLSYLYGDILAVSRTQVVVLVLSMIGVLLVLTRVWSQLLQIIVHEDLAFVEGVNVKRLRMVFIALLAFVVAMGIQMVGVLLMTAMLIIPAATARCYAKSPVSLAIIASGIAIGCISIGMVLTFAMDIPTGPAMVVCMGLAFFMSLLLKRKAN
jgi:zinc transport system permease protein